MREGIHTYLWLIRIVVWQEQTQHCEAIILQLLVLKKSNKKYASKFGKLGSDHRTEKGQFPFQSQRKAMPKNVQTTTQLRSSHTLAK